MSAANVPLRVAPIAALSTMLPIAAHAFQLATTRDGHATQWADPRVPYAIAESSTIAGLGPATRAALDAWTLTASSSFAGEWTGTATTAMGRILVSSMPAGMEFGGALAVTVSQFRIGTGQITGSDVYLDVELGAFDLESVILHEVGHAIGLAHTCGIDGRERPSCFDLDGLPARDRARILNAVMAPSISAGEERRALTVDDQEGEIALYPGDRGAAPVIGGIAQDCRERAWRVIVDPTAEITLRFEDGTTRAAEVRARGNGSLLIAPAGLADVVATNPITRGVSARVGVNLTDVPACAAPDAGVIETPPIDDGGCDCTSTRDDAPAILLILAFALGRKRR